MVLVKPTARWLGKTQRIPRGRKIERNGLSGEIEVTEAEAKYLLDRFVAVAVEMPEASADPKDTPPPADPLERSTEEGSPPEPTEEVPPEVPPVETDAPPTDAPPSEETLVLHYLNATEPEAIAQQIKGIGRKTADELVAARPIAWDKVNEILSDRQVEALVAFVTSND